MTIVDALKNLYVALSGDPDDVADVANNAEMVNKIAELVESGGAVLPTDEG